MHMHLLGAEAAGQVSHVGGDQLETLVEDADQTQVPACPHRVSQVFRRHRVIGTLDLDMTVAMYFALSLPEVGKTLSRQRQERCLFHAGKYQADLTPRRAVNARVGD